MATVMEFTSPAAEFPLGTVFENLPGVTVELERLVPNRDLVIPYFWVRGAEVADIEASFEGHPGVQAVKLVDSLDDESLMRVSWDREYVGILSALSAAELVVLSAVGTSEGWEFEVRGETHEEVGEFRSYCQEHDIPVEVTAVHALLPVQGEGYELTDTQREALVAAHDHGYFDSPREASLEEVADTLGITQQSLSSRLRRGHRRLVAATLINA